MKPIGVSTTVERPRERVFAFLDVLANHEQFTDHFLADWTLEGPPSGAGAKARVRVLAPGPDDWIEMTVIESQAPARNVERSVGANGKRRTRGTYTLEEDGYGRTAVRFELAYEQAPLLDRFTAPLTRIWLRRQNSRAMARLKELLESRAPAEANRSPDRP